MGPDLLMAQANLAWRKRHCSHKILWSWRNRRIEARCLCDRVIDGAFLQRGAVFESQKDWSSRVLAPDPVDLVASPVPFADQD